MDDAIIISNLNDFIFCPASIYFHNLYGHQNTLTYQTEKQINGSGAHAAIDEHTYSSKKSILTSLEIYSQRYHIVGKIDQYDMESGVLTERKRKIKRIYDGYIFQLYAQYFGLSEMGYPVKTLRLYSLLDNKSYPILLPKEDPEMLAKFEKVIEEMRVFSLEDFMQTNTEKCKNCIYEPACDRGSHD